MLIARSTTRTIVVTASAPGGLDGARRRALGFLVIGRAGVPDA